MDDNSKNGPESGNVNLPLALTRQQAQVFELLRGLSTEQEKFHEWYLGALEVLSSKSPDKIAQAANSIRELCEKLATQMEVQEFQSPLPPMKSLMQNFPIIKASGYLEGWKGKVINDKLDQFLTDLEETGKLFGDPPRNARLQLALTTSDPQAEFMSKSYREARDDAFKRIGAFFQNVTHHRHQPDEGEYDSELAESIDWLGCECFPFEWRFNHAMSALKRLKKSPQAYRLLKTISEYGIMPERLESMLDLFKTLLKKPSDELRWSIQFKDVAPVISLGLANDKPSTKKLAEECKDLLLKMGFSDFLNLGNEEGEK